MSSIHMLSHILIGRQEGLPKYQNILQLKMALNYAENFYFTKSTGCVWDQIKISFIHILDKRGSLNPC